MPNPRRNWDKQLEGNLPDSRLKFNRPIVKLGRRDMERVYCANCGGDGGLVTAEWAAHVFFLCDTCVGVNGPLNCPDIAEEVVRGKHG